MTQDNGHTAVEADARIRRFFCEGPAEFGVYQEGKVRALLRADIKSVLESRDDALSALDALRRETDQLVNTLALATDRATRSLYDLDSIASHAERKLAPVLAKSRAALLQARGEAG